MSEIKQKIKDMIKEEIKLHESLGGGIITTINQLNDYVDNLIDAGYINPTEGKKLRQYTNDLRKNWLKLLKGKGLKHI